MTTYFFLGLLASLFVIEHKHISVVKFLGGENGIWGSLFGVFYFFSFFLSCGGSFFCWVDVCFCCPKRKNEENFVR